MRTLDGKVVVITGAGSGIGRALAVAVADRGGLLALCDWDEVGLVETASLVQNRTHQEVRTDKVDVRDREAVHAWADAVHDGFGRVDMLVNNAGVALHGEFEEVEYDDFAWVLDVDFWGVVHGTKAFLPYLIASGDGHLVNVSSLFGIMAWPGQTAYTAAKFAVRGFTESLRQEMLCSGHPVQVTCVHPGGIKTAIARSSRTTVSHDHEATAAFFDTRLARTTPERAAEVILDGVLANRARVLVGLDAVVLDLVVRVSGAAYQGIFARLARRFGP